MDFPRICTHSLLTLYLLSSAITQITLPQTNDSYSHLLTDLKSVDEEISEMVRDPVARYQLTKINHSIIYGQADNIEALSTLNVYDSEGFSYPIVFHLGANLYSIKGQQLHSLDEGKVLFSCSRNQHIYTATLGLKNTVTIKALFFNKKNPSFEVQDTFSIPSSFGTIVDYSNAFSLSQQLYAFTTTRGYVVFVQPGGNIQQSFQLNNQHPLHLQRVNTQQMIYSNESIYLIGNSGKLNSLRECRVPADMRNFKIKFDDNNWRKFYAQSGSRVYVFEIKDRSCGPVEWYPLFSEEDEFHVGASILLLQTSKHSHHFYFNLTDKKLLPLYLPKQECATQNYKMMMVPRNLGSHILCEGCLDVIDKKTQYCCYILQNLNESIERGLEKHDYSKFRIPIVFFSLCIVIYLSMSRKKKKKLQQQQEKMRKILEKEDQKFANSLKDQKMVEETTHQHSQH